MTKRKNLPLLGITLGDPAGIGPEVAIRAVISTRVRNICKPVMLGDVRIIERAVKDVACAWPIEAFQPTDNLRQVVQKIRGRKLIVLDLGGAPAGQIKLGRLSAVAGRAAYDWVVAGALLALRKEIDALVTAPLNKEAVLRAGIKGFKGHTELLAAMGKTKRYAMMLAGGNLRVVLVTTHVAMNRISRLLSTDLVLEKIELVQEYLIRRGIEKPKIAVAALNPHAGEGGAFGDQEKRLIEPAVSSAHQKGIHVTGPFPADTLFSRHQVHPYDAIVVMYHDQGLIPLKLLSFGKGVNITLGLPFVRTSPDHGTAFELAGTGRADPGSMIEAICEAVSNWPAIELILFTPSNSPL